MGGPPRGSDVVGRLPQQPLASVLAQRDGPDGVLRQRGDGGEKVGGERLGQRDTQGTGDDGERQRLVAGGAAGVTSPRYPSSSGDGKTSAPISSSRPPILMLASRNCRGSS